MTKVISHSRAIVYAIIGNTIWVMGDTCTKLSGQARLPFSQIIVLSSLFCIATILAITAVRRQTRLLMPKQWKLEIFRALLCTVMAFINVAAFTRLPLASVYVVLFSIPMWVVIAAAVFMRETLSWRQALAILAGFGGVVLALYPGDMHFQSIGLTDYIILAFFPILGSINIVLIRFLGRREHSESMSFFPQAVRALVLLPLCLWQFMPMTLGELLTIAAIGFFSGVGVLLVVAAYKHAPAAMVSPFAYSQLIAGALAGYLIWHDVPSGNLVAGSAIIIASGFYIAHRARRTDAARALA